MHCGSRSTGKSGSGSVGPQSDGSQYGLARSSFAKSVIISPTGHQLKGHPVPPNESRQRMKAMSLWTDMHLAAEVPL